MHEIRYEIRQGAYYDSVVLMQLQKGLAALPGVVDAGVVMATPANKEVLTAAGYNYISTQDPVKALQMVIEEKPDFIFIDLVMPVVSGYELCSQIRRMEAFKDTPIVMFSSNALDNLRVKMAGADDTLSKPIAPKLLLETVAAWFKSEQPVRKSFRLARR